MSPPHVNERWKNIRKQINNAFKNIQKNKLNRTLSAINLPPLYNSPVKPPRSKSR